MTTKFNLAALTVLAAVLFAAPLTASAYVTHDTAAMSSSTLGTTSEAHHHHKHHRHHRHPR
jgi:hypothetical protein